MKRYSTTIKSADQLKTAIDNSRSAGIFKNGESLKQFADNVAAYIAYCEEYGVLVQAEARPDDSTLTAWYEQACADEVHNELVRVYGSTVERGLRVVEYAWPDGSGGWSQCADESLWPVVAHYEAQGCQVSVDGRGV